MRIDVERTDDGTVDVVTVDGPDGLVELYFEGLLRYRAEIGYGSDNRVRHSFHADADELDALIELDELDEDEAA
jgi:hypothetical protein